MSVGWQNKDHQRQLDKLGKRMQRAGIALREALAECDTYERREHDRLTDKEKEEILKVVEVAKGFLSRDGGMGRHQFGEDLIEALNRFVGAHASIPY